MAAQLLTENAEVRAAFARDAVDPDVNVRRLVVKALMHAMPWPEEGTRVVLAGLADASPLVRLAAVEVARWRQSADADVRTALGTLREDPDERVRRAAAAARSQR